ncbi:MAG TPA: DUF1835 domain-containing protein [Kofleriaceae bacterium]|jgi:hypothetical protein|nr:DUF1835 domain-containing protein [Kofleriaceae bacterium]
MKPTFIHAIHLVSCESAGGHVKRVVKPDGEPRTNLKILSEQLTVGPCDVDPVRHVELRRAWNAEIGDEYLKTFGLEDLRAAVAGDRPVVIWATRAYAELVWRWWILDGLRRLGPLAQPPILIQPKPDDPLSTVGGTSPKAGRAALAVARAISDDEFREGAELWRLYTSPDPRAFDEARRGGSSAFPEFSESADVYGTWFPRLEDGRLRLAEHDERLLASLTDEWLTPWVLSEPVFKERGWQRLLWPFGTFVPVWRLRQWAANGVVAHEVRNPDNGNPFEQDAFRLTDRTRLLLANGMEGVGDVPSIYVGGCRINDPASPWVRVVDGSDWRITPHT